jgi:hypothetical protein
MDIFEYMNDPVKAADFARLHMTSPAFRNATKKLIRQKFTKDANNISVEIDESGKPYLAIRKGSETFTARTMQEATTIKNQPFSSVRKITGRQARSSVFQPSIGGYSSDPLEYIAQRLGGTIQVKSYSLTDKDAYKGMFADAGYDSARGVSGHGFPVVQNDIGHMISFTERGKDAPVSVEEFERRMKDLLGLRMDTSSAQLSKRLNTLVSTRAFAIAGTMDEVGLRVAEFTSEQYFKGISSLPGMGEFRRGIRAEVGKNTEAYISRERIQADAKEAARLNGTTEEIELKKIEKELKQNSRSRLKRAMEDVAEKNLDGHIIMSGSGLDTFIDQKEKRIAQLKRIESTKRLNGNTSELISIRSEIAAQEDLIKQLKIMKMHGGSANFRNIQNEMFKGDAIILPDDQYEKVARSILNQPNGELPHILAYKGQGKKELGFTGSSITTLELRKKATALEVSLSQVTTFPEIFTPEYLERSFNVEADRIMGVMSSPISRTSSLGRMADEILNNTVVREIVSEADYEEYLQLQDFARRIKSMIDYNIRPEEIDTLGRQFISMYDRHFSKLRNGQTAMRNGAMSGLPNYDYRRKVVGGLRAEISPEGTTRPFARKADMFDIARNTVSYDKVTGRVTLNTIDAPGALAALGGADADDTVSVIVKYDKEAKKAIAFIYRDPTEAGEFLLMDADLTTLPLMNVDRNVAGRVRDLSRQKKQIMKELNSKDTTFRKALLNLENQKNLSPRSLKTSKAKIERLEQLRRDLNSVQRDLDAILSANLDSISIRSSFGPNSGVNAPKGFGLNQAGLDSQYSGSVIRSNTAVDSSVSHLDFLNSYRQERSALLSDANSIYRFSGTKTNLADPRFFRNIDEDAMRAYAKNLPESSKVSRRAIDEAAGLAKSGKIADVGLYRAAILNESQMVLEKWANVKTALDEIYGAGFRDNYEKFKDLDLELIPVMQREKVIDAAVKNADLDLLDTARSITDDAARAMIRNVIKIHQAGLGEGIGFDRYVYDTKMSSVYDIIDSELEGSGITLDQVLLERGRVHGIVADGVEASKRLSEAMAKAIEDRSIASSVLADFAPTADEITTAQEYIDNYVSAAKDVSRRTPESILSGMLDGSLDASTYLEDGEELNRRNLQFLMDRGLLEDGSQKRLERQMLAIGKVLEARKAELSANLRHGIFSSVLTESSDSRIGVSIGDLFLSSVNNYKYKKTIDSYSKVYQDLLTFGDVTDQNKDSFSALQNTLQDLHSELKGAFPWVKDMRGDEGNTMGLPALTRDDSFGLKTGLGKDGSTLLGLRNTADETSEAVSKAAHVMQRFTMDGFKQMVRETKGAKGVLMGLGFMVALGALHGDKNLDRTPEDMGGPPLLPGGSAYEDYSETDDFSSIYSMASGNSMSPGVLYQVNVNGRIEPTELQNRIQSITGGSINSTIYKGRETVRSGYQDSQSIMSDRFGF